MNTAASYAKRLTVRQAGLTLVGFAALGVLAPLVLRLTREETLHVTGRVLAVGSVASGTVLALTWALARRHRYALRALALGSTAIEPTDVEALRAFTYRAVTAQLSITIAAMATLATALLRPAGLSAEVARELAMLGATVAFAVAVPSLVLAQRLTGTLFEVAPIDAVTTQLEALRERGVTRRRTRQNLLYAVVVPVALVGVGGALAGYAHLRALTEQSRTTTAAALARGVIGSGEKRASVGQQAASRLARKNGYDVTLSEHVDGPHVSRTAERIVYVVPVERGSATVSFASNLPLSRTFPLAAVAALFVLIAAGAAVALASLFSRDLTGAAEHLRRLGTERVLAGDEMTGFDARFLVVERLGAAARELAGRFRVFASAQERALEARETAQRMRGLLFASVSHDLKTPLNAILGFADSLDRETLTAPQVESLDLIATRGRELVALIETILDAARVEAGQLVLTKKRTSVAGLVYLALKRARELAGESSEVRIEMAEGLPAVTVDGAHLGRALGVIIAHALRAPTSDGLPPSVAVRASVAGGGDEIRIEVVHGQIVMTADDLRGLFTPQSSSRAKGLTLGLSLARALFGMHGGRIEVSGARGESTVVHALLPV